MVILPQAMSVLLDSMPAGPVLCTSKQYSVTFCSLLILASVVIFDAFWKQIVLDNAAKFGAIAANISYKLTDC